MKKRNIVLIITSCIILSVIAIAVGARNFVHSIEGKSIPSMSGVKVSANSEVNASEAEAFFILSKELEIGQSISNENSNIHPDYIAYLQKYLRSSHINLSTSKVRELKELINELRYIIQIENEIEFDKMTIDGREIATQLLKEIYEVCGVKLEYSIDGKIEKIMDSSGNILYQNEGTLLQGDFRIDTFLLVILAILALLSIGIVLMEKSQILAREVIFDGFDEQKYA